MRLTHTASGCCQVVVRIEQWRYPMLYGSIEKEVERSQDKTARQRDRRSMGRDFSRRRTEAGMAEHRQTVHWGGLATPHLCQVCKDSQRLSMLRSDCEVA